MDKEEVGRSWKDAESCTEEMFVPELKRLVRLSPTDEKSFAHVATEEGSSLASLSPGEITLASVATAEVLDWQEVTALAQSFKYRFPHTGLPPHAVRGFDF
ncbi:MAG: hypothetical protein WC797_03260 [Candidatus Paceibacterota bacterium]